MVRERGLGGKRVDGESGGGERGLGGEKVRGERARGEGEETHPRPPSSSDT